MDAKRKETNARRSDGAFAIVLCGIIWAMVYILGRAIVDGVFIQ